MGKLLIVDDSRTIQKQIMILTKSAYPHLEVIAASSGEEALKIIPDIKDDIKIAIFDYNMEGMTGLELVEKARQYIDIKRIILCSANIQESIRNKALLHGVIFKEKPLNPDNFKLIIDQVLGDQHD